MKKLAFSMAAMAFMLSASAAEGDEDQNNTATEATYDGEDLKPNGVYGGLGLDLVNNEWQTSTTAVDWQIYDPIFTNAWGPAAGIEDLVGVDYSNNATRLAPVLFLGYGFLYKNLFIAPEIAVRLAPNVEVYNNRSDFVTDVDRHAENRIRCNGIQPILAVKMGYYCARWNSVVYAKFGAIYKKFTVDDTEYVCNGWLVGEDTSNVGSRYICKTNSKKFSNWRFLVGLGLSKSLSKYITLSAEMIYTFGKKMKFDIAGQGMSAAAYPAGNQPATAIATDKINQTIELNDKGTFGVGIYAQCSIWKPKN